MVSKKKKTQLYTTGQLNNLIDSLIHPLFKEDSGYILIDTFLHALVEQNPQITIRKFIKYNLPRIVEQLRKR